MEHPARQALKFLSPLKQWWRERHRQWVFWRSIRAFARLPVGKDPSHALLQRLISAWGNPSYAAPAEFLLASLRHARTRDPILECGSGLSTILLSIAAQKRGARVYTLEHDAAWAERVRGALAARGVDNVELCVGGLRRYDGFHWYEPPLERMPRFALVICDGPPGNTPGGRYGLLPVMRAHLEDGCTILLDDAHRAAERRIAQQWADELGSDVVFSSGQRAFATLVVPADPSNSR